MMGKEWQVTGTPLAHRADFVLADVIVRPSLRTLEGPLGSQTLEPKIMQVLLAFVAAGDAVVTRDDLIRDCWNGRIVGEDAVNRTIAELRRGIREIGAGFAVETIPRIGYRLDFGASSQVAPAGAAPTGAQTGVDRRIAALGLAAGLAGAGAAAFWWQPWQQRPSAESLIENGRRALYNGFPDSGQVAAGFLEAALEQRPRSAEAWGLLAFAHRDIAEAAQATEVSRAVQASEYAARRALALDPKQGDALAALAGLRPYFGDYAAGEDRLMSVLAVDPDNFLAAVQLVPLLQGVGRIRASAVWNDRAGRVAPHSPVPEYRRALKLWSMGKLAEADQAMDRTMQLWPRHPSVWNARMMLFAFTGRPRAGLTLLDEKASRPASLKQPQIDLWRISLRALDTRNPIDVAAATAANIRSAPRSPGFANNALMTLSMLGERDAAFDVAQGYFLRRGPLITTLWAGAGELPVSALRWRRSMALFVPPTASMRADARFDELMEAMGIAAYWRQRKVRPDYQLGLA